MTVAIVTLIVFVGYLILGRWWDRQGQRTPLALRNRIARPWRRTSGARAARCQSLPAP